MSNTGHCLITGCDFLDVERGRIIRGDLHQLFDILIFNANGCEWVYLQPDDKIKEDVKTVRCSKFYEKNNQIVFPLALASFNEAAHKFLNEMLNAERKHIITFGDPH